MSFVWQSDFAVALAIDLATFRSYYRHRNLLNCNDIGQWKFLHVIQNSTKLAKVDLTFMICTK
jgi:hypothetical protein